MDRASSLSYPGSKTLSGWWRPLQARQPHTIQVGYRYVHRVEASVQVLREQAVDPFVRFLLQAIALQSTAPDRSDIDALQERLGIPAALLRPLLANLVAERLITPTGPLTEPGRNVVAQGHYPLQVRERQTLTFVEQLDAGGVRTAPPQFLPLASCPAVPWEVEASHHFESESLRLAIAQPTAWKRQWAFPGEIVSVVEGPAGNWQNVILDRSERVLLVVICVTIGGTDEWQVYAVRPDGWHLGEQPALRLPASLDAVSMGFAAPPGQEQLRDAWRAWCRERNLPANEVEMCSLTYQPPRLLVHAPDRLVQRLRAAKSDLLRGEAWLLIGDGYVRTAALLSLA